MNFAILVVFVALLNVSCGRQNENQAGKQKPAGNLSSKISMVGSAAYETMNNIKLWSALRKKQKQLETTRLQLQRLYDKRQEKLNKLNGLPRKQNVPVKVLPVAIIPEVDSLIAYRPNLHLLDNINPFKKNKPNLQGNLAGNPSQPVGYGGAQGYQQTSNPSYYSQGTQYTDHTGVYPSTPQGIHNQPNVGYQNQPVGYSLGQGTVYPQAQQSTYAQGTGHSSPPVQSNTQAEANHGNQRPPWYWNWNQELGFK